MFVCVCMRRRYNVTVTFNDNTALIEQHQAAKPIQYVQTDNKVSQHKYAITSSLFHNLL